MTRVNGKAPKPPIKLTLLKLERDAVQSSALFEIVGGAQDGGALAVTVLHPDGPDAPPLLAIQTVLSPDLKTVVKEGPLDPVQALAMLPPAEPPQETLQDPLA